MAHKPEVNNVEVDMVPLIDIISLLLMFLIIVGDTSASGNSVKMRLPTADQAKTEKEWGLDTTGRIVIQIKPPEDGDKNGKYFAVFNNMKHATNEDKSLKDHLKQYVADELAHGRAKENPDHTLNIPVKLRIPADCPMQEAEKVLYTIASVQLVDIQYATDGNGPAKKPPH